jgi:RND family efflux transporter MFP subunit
MYKDNTNPVHSMHVVSTEPERAPLRVAPELEPTPELRQPGRWFYVGWVLAVVAVLCILTALLLARNSKLSRQTLVLNQEAQLGQRVLVQPVLHPPAARALDLPATLRGFTETPIYAKIPGYLKVIKVDKGDRVTKGQVLAILESPELEQEVANARATYNLNLITDQRYQALAQEGVFARQTADESHNTMLASQARLNQYLAMETYKVITAPFSGVVTARSVDPGALIPQATTSAANTPLLALATLSPLRVYTDVPQSLAPFVHDGDSASITVGEYPGREFPGKVARHPEAIATATRTMLVEVDLPNREQLLLPGMYAKVSLHISAPSQARMVPDDALIFRDGKPYVPVVRNNQLKLVPVTLGYDDGVNVQINGEVADQDLVALSVGQSAHDGERVQPIRQER